MLTLFPGVFDELFVVDGAFDNPSRRLWRPIISSGTRNSFQPAVESYRKEGKVVYRLALPGVEPKDLDISVADGRVIVKGERTPPSEVDDTEWLIREFQYGKFETSFALPKLVDTDKVNAAFNNGILEITLPVAKAALPKKIEIQALQDGTKAGELKATA